MVGFDDGICIPFNGYKMKYTDLSLGIIYKPVKKKKKSNNK